MKLRSLVEAALADQERRLLRTKSSELLEDVQRRLPRVHFCIVCRRPAKGQALLCGDPACRTARLRHLGRPSNVGASRGTETDG